MKKIKLEGKLDLNKTSISKLNSEEMDAIHGGKGILSIGVRCTQPSRCHPEEWSKGIFCRQPR